MILDFLFPKTCVGCGRPGAYFCSSCVSRLPLTHPICPMCGRGAIGGISHSRCRRAYGLDGLITLFSYRDGVEVAIKRLKYRFVRDLGEAFVKAGLYHFDPSLRAFFQREGYGVTPVPLHQARERWRGFNQAALLGELLAKEIKLEFLPLLKRTRYTQPLAQLSEHLTTAEAQSLRERYPSSTQLVLAQRKLLAEKKIRRRAREMRGAFQLQSQKSLRAGPEAKIKNQKFLLVDDVWTSGATILECAKALKRNGASNVWGFTFARSRR